MTEQEFAEMAALLENYQHSTTVVGIATDINGAVFLSNSGNYMVHRDDALETLKACEAYLSHIDEQSVISFNNWLLGKRMSDREKDARSLRKKAAKGSSTFIYVMKNTRTGHFKIGRSRNPSTREKTLQSEEPQIELIMSFKANSKTEGELHEKFNDKRIRGEWFNLNEEDLLFISGLIE